MKPVLALSLRYLLFAIPGHLAWELLQLPLYAVWTEASASRIAFAVAHCMAGDALISAACLWLAVRLVGGAAWPRERVAYLRVAAAAIALGIIWSVFSEWLNVSVRGNWAYSASMPRLPLLGTGFAPLAQWLIVPAVAFACAWHGRARKDPDPSC